MGESLWLLKEPTQQNLSHLYPTLLFVDAVMTLVGLIEAGDFPAFEDQILRSKTAVCLYQACYRTLLDQDSNGSWNNSLEETAYGTIILSQATRLDLFRDFDEQLRSAIRRAVIFMQSSNQSPPKPEHLWVEKVGYASPVLAEAYKLAALRASSIQTTSQTRVGSSLREDTSVVPKLANLLHRTPLFSGTPEWEIRASMIEGTLFRPIIRALRLSVFTRKGVEEDKYFDVIPLAWPSCNNRTRIFAPSCFLFEGMMAALLNYQVDEFMEAVAGINYADDIPELRRMIDDVVASISKETLADTSNGGCPSNGVDVTSKTNGHHTTTGIDDSKRQEVLIPLQKFVSRALKHPAILSASPWDRKNVTSELRIYL